MFGVDMKTFKIFLSILFLFSNANAQTPEKLQGVWMIQIENLQHEIITTLVIHFTENKAGSCLDGNWKQVVVDSYKTSDRQFFPVNEPLSYDLVNNKISIGRNEICDAYLQLSADFNEITMAGDYITFGWGGKKLGYFSLSRVSQ